MLFMLRYTNPTGQRSLLVNLEVFEEGGRPEDVLVCFDTESKAYAFITQEGLGDLPGLEVVQARLVKADFI